ncbi:sigma-70 family RNA polymerase sigma factor [Saccharomonospora sp. NPDC006951]
MWSHSIVLEGMENSDHAAPPRERAITTAWRDDRDYLLATASRILRDDGEANDVVAEAFARLAAQPIDAVRDARGWLIVVVRRLALDRLRSAHLRLCEPVDPAEPRTDSTARDLGIAGPADPADRITLDDEIRRALSVVVGRLTPGERAAFILHDVFGVSFDEIGTLVGRSGAACRQLATRARASIRATYPLEAEHTPPPERELDRVAQRFAEACADGDISELATLLYEGVSGWAVLHGAVLNEVHGRDAVAAGLVALYGRRSPWGVAPFALDDVPAVLVTRRGEPAGLVRLVTDADGLITGLQAVLIDAGTRTRTTAESGSPGARLTR